MKDKVTIILLPGLNGTVGLFQPLIDCAPQEYHVMSISYPTHEKRSYSQLKEFVQKRLSELDSPYILVGESFSGPLSLMLGQAKPQGLIGIVLVATFIQAPNFKVGRFLPWTIGFTLTKPLYDLRLLLTNAPNKGFINAISKELQKVSPKVLADRIQSIFTVNAHQALTDCDVPLIYFRGTRDFVVPQKNLNLITKVKPDIAVARFDTQHFLLQSKPNKAWQEISQFVDRLTHNG